MPAKKSKTPTLGERLISALEDVVAHESGESLSLEQVRPRPIDVRAIRASVRMSQARFATEFGLSKRALQEWEQGRRQPDPAVCSYLTVIAREPAMVRRALHSA